MRPISKQVPNQASLTTTCKPSGTRPLSSSMPDQARGSSRPSRSYESTQGDQRHRSMPDFFPGQEGDPGAGHSTPRGDVQGVAGIKPLNLPPALPPVGLASSTLLSLVNAHTSHHPSSATGIRSKRPLPQSNQEDSRTAPSQSRSTPEPWNVGSGIDQVEVPEDYQPYRSDTGYYPNISINKKKFIGSGQLGRYSTDTPREEARRGS